VRVHHLNCGTMCPWAVGELVCHCLLAESRHGLVLVETGFGAGDIAHPRRLGRAVRTLARPRLDPSETALAQVTALGFAARDVRHIVLTHLDPDHAGGLGDFPEAEVHLMEDELRAASGGRDPLARPRYRRAQWAHGPHWSPHRESGERWFGFECVQAVAGDDDILLVPLRGHSRGHAGVAVRSDRGWLLHAGDAYFFADELTDDSRPWTLEWFQRVTAVDSQARRANQRRLRALVNEHGNEVRVFCAHDASELRAAAADRDNQPLQAVR
jgi:glyoxylase-like metal-dependent hydrolase (beta-lactamase superfamily II)